MTENRKRTRVRKLLQSYENLPILDRRIARAITNQKKQHPSEELKIFVKNLLSAHAYLLTLEKLTEGIEKVQKEYSFCNADFFALNDTIALEILDFLSHNNTDYADACVQTIRFLDQYDFLTFFETYSKTEQILNTLPIFSKSNETTKNIYRTQVANHAKKYRISEAESAKLLSAHLSAHVKHPIAKKIYFPAIVTISVGITVMMAFFCHRISVFVLLFLPIYGIVKACLDRLYSFLIPPAVLPGYDLKEIPKDASTLVVITTLLFGADRDAFLFERLECFWLQNPYDHVMYGILGDFADSKQSFHESDNATLQNARAQIATLNARYGNHFCLLMRQRTYNSKEKRYMGYERKRGAVLELSRIATGAPHSFFSEDLPMNFLKEVRYLMTLDADTELSMDAVPYFVGIMLHPENQPVIKDGIVTAGYAILQPRMDPSLLSFSKTPFSLLQCGNGGYDLYASASFDLYQSVFGEGIFCGKGIIDLSYYRRLLDQTFPQDQILSHDLLEGSYLRCGHISNFPLTDSCPLNPLSDLNRQHRWIRGDIQTIPYLFPTVKNQNNEKIKNPISKLSKLKILDNVFRLLTPVFVAVSLISTLFLDARTAIVYFIVSLSFLFIPFVFSIIDTIKNANRRFFSCVISNLWRNFFSSFYQLTTLIAQAFCTLDAIIRSLWRMLVSKKHLLEWTTALESERHASGFFAYLFRFFPSFAVGFLFLTFSPYGALHFLGLLWCSAVIVAFLLGRPFKKAEKKLSPSQVKTLENYVQSMWQYYADFVNLENNFLPPDNYQLLPTEALAHRTSPTNIGLYLLSVLAVRDFGIISTQQLYERVSQTMDTLEQLPRWHGHLYNWYDTCTLEILGTPFVSTVDSGNFVTSLTACGYGLLDYGNEKPELTQLSKRLLHFAQESDFTKLYDRKRDLFYIGFDGTKEIFSENHYDLYMSEARTTGYYAIAIGAIPKKHWKMLGRTFLTKNHFLGLLSWSGTMFEYFMPTLLLPVFPDSLQSEALHFAYAMQVSDATHRIWGRSESGYFHFDADMNYQYQAFGVPKLALKAKQERENVLAPYASFLALSIAPSAAIQNLEKIRQLGAYDKYGFYEAIDFTPERVGSGYAFIRSFMAHHIGMSMIACANAVFQNRFVKRFLQDPRMRSATELLMEKIPVDVVVYRRPTEDLPISSPRPIRNYQKMISEEIPGKIPQFAMISNGKCRWIATASGDIGMEYASITMSRNNLSDGSPFHGFQFFLKCDGQIYYPLDGAFTDTGTAIHYDATHPNLRLHTTLSFPGRENCFWIHFEACGEFQKITPLLLFEPILVKEKDYFAHPAFSKLSMEASFDKERNLLYFCRRGRLSGETDRYLAITLLQNTPFSFSTRRDTILPLCYSEDDLSALTEIPLPTQEVGASIDPICLIRKSSDSIHGQYSCDFLILYGESKEEITAILSSLRNERKKSLVFNSKKIMSSILQEHLQAAGLDENQYRYVRLLLSAIYCPMPPKTPNHFSTIADLWKFGISGDFPIMLFSLRVACLSTGSVSGIVTGLLRAQRYLAFFGIRFDLVFLYEENDHYSAPCYHDLLRLIKDIKSDLFLNRKGGIFLLQTAEVPPYLEANRHLYGVLDAFTLFEHLENTYYESTSRMPFPKILKKPQELLDLDTMEKDGTVYGGRIMKSAFCIHKGIQKAPWSYLYCGKEFGTLLTQNSLGYTWFKNAREGRLTPFSNDPLTDLIGERLICVQKGKKYDLCAVSNLVIFHHGFAQYCGKIDTEPFVVEVGIDPSKFVKLIRCKIPQNATLQADFSVILGVNDFDCRTIKITQSDDTTFYQNYGNDTFRSYGAYLHRFIDGDWNCFLFGICKTEPLEIPKSVLSNYQGALDFERTFDDYKKEAEQLCSVFTVDTGNPIFDRFINFYLPYQAIYVRLSARTGFYQSSGAFGFRDQLQDSLCALFLKSELTKQQILLSASRQYIQGDVLHWWHETPQLRGIRSRCSDDLLWLPYVTALYIEATQDDSLLHFMIPYLTSPLLQKQEQERYEQPEISELSESLYRHCIRAIDKACQFGRHGLPLIGSGDWNDGMNRIGEGGDGESVWLAFFLRLVLRSFIPICEEENDLETAQRYRSIQVSLQESIEKYCYDEDHYLRAFFDNGTPIGRRKDPACAIDLLPQAFAAIVDGPTDRTIKAMHTAYHQLLDEKSQVLRLFTPPIPSTEKRFGYISGYADGLRENGGQYTHGALWYVWGCYAIGEFQRGFELLSMMHPTIRSTTSLAPMYRTEPYALTGDVYSAPGHEGRGGWSQYTGSASWYYRIFLTQTLGYREIKDQFYLQPALCDSFPQFRLTIRKKETVYQIYAHFGETNAVRLDGTEGKFPMFFDKKSHFLEIVLEKSSNML